MKKHCLILILYAFAASATDVSFKWIDSASLPLGPFQMKLYPLFSPTTINAGGNIGTDPLLRSTDTNGVCLITNLIGGINYRGEFKGPIHWTTNWFFVPATNVVLYSTNLTVPPPTNGEVLFLDDGTSAGEQFEVDP